MKNLLQSPCNEVNKLVPYFKDFTSLNENKEYKDMDDYLFKRLEKLENTPFKYGDRDMESNPDVQALPDAVYRVSEASSRSLVYDVRVNDHHLWQFHRENGMTKAGIKLKNTKTQFLRSLQG